MIMVRENRKIIVNPCIKQDKKADTNYDNFFLSCYFFHYYRNMIWIF